MAWRCRDCDFVNDPQNNFCDVCGADSPAMARIWKTRLKRLQVLLERDDEDGDRGAIHLWTEEGFAESGYERKHMFSIELRRQRLSDLDALRRAVDLGGVAGDATVVKIWGAGRVATYHLPKPFRQLVEQRIGNVRRREEAASRLVAALSSHDISSIARAADDPSIAGHEVLDAHAGEIELARHCVSTSDEELIVWWDTERVAVCGYAAPYLGEIERRRELMERRRSIGTGLATGDAAGDRVVAAAWIYGLYRDDDPTADAVAQALRRDAARVRLAAAAEADDHGEIEGGARAAYALNAISVGELQRTRADLAIHIQRLRLLRLALQSRAETAISALSSFARCSLLTPDERVAVKAATSRRSGTRSHGVEPEGVGEASPGALALNDYVRAVREKATVAELARLFHRLEPFSSVSSLSIGQLELGRLARDYTAAMGRGVATEEMFLRARQVGLPLLAVEWSQFRRRRQETFHENGLRAALRTRSPFRRALALTSWRVARRPYAPADLVLMRAAAIGLGRALTAAREASRDRLHLNS